MLLLVLVLLVLKYTSSADVEEVFDLNGKAKFLEVPENKAVVLVSKLNRTHDTFFLHKDGKMMKTVNTSTITYMTSKDMAVLFVSNTSVYIISHQNKDFSRVYDGTAGTEGISVWMDAFWQVVKVNRTHSVVTLCTGEEMALEGFLKNVTYVAYDKNKNAFVSNKDRAVLIRAADLFRGKNKELQVPVVNLQSVHDIKAHLSLPDGSIILATKFGPKRIRYLEKVQTFIKGACRHLTQISENRIVATVGNRAYLIEIFTDKFKKIEGFESREDFEVDTYFVGIQYVEFESDQSAQVFIATHESAVYMLQNPWNKVKKLTQHPPGQTIHQIYYKPPYENFIVAAEDLFVYTDSSGIPERHVLPSGHKIVNGRNKTVYIATFDSLYRLDP